MTAGDIYTVDELIGVLEIRDGQGNLVTILEPAVDVVQIVTPDFIGPRGPQGALGDPGPSGPTGPTGPQGPFAPVFEQQFVAASDFWVIVHNMDAYPVTTIYDLDGYEISGDVHMPDRNTVVVTFAVPVSGTARLKA